MIVDEAEFHAELKRAYMEGVTELRAQFACDLRMLADDFTSQLFELRCEVRKALGLPPLAGPDRGTLQ